MSLSRTNSRTHFTETTQTIESNDHSSLVVSTNNPASPIEQQEKDKTPIKNVPQMKLKLPGVQIGSETKKNELSPRAIPKSPRTLKSARNLFDQNARAADKNSLASEPPPAQTSAKPPSSPRNDIGEKSANSSAQIAIPVQIEPLSSEPTFQVRRVSFSVPVKLLVEKKETWAATRPTSPRPANLPSSTSTPTSTTASTSDNKKEITIEDNSPSIEKSSKALLGLIFKEHEKKPLTADTAKVIGREDVYFAVKALPKTLTHLTEFPDNGISSISELLVAMFADDLRKKPIWKQVVSALEKGKQLDDGSVPFGETDPEVKRKYAALLKPLALIIADCILGKDKTLNTCGLPAHFLKLLFEGDKKLLEICVNSTKLRIREMNNARLFFLFNIVVTRFAQVLVTQEFSDRPSQVESWFQSEVIDALGKGITSLFDDFLTQSNQQMPAELMTKFRDRAAAEIREDEAIKQFKQIQLTKTRIDELKQKESRKLNSRGSSHSRASSFVELTRLKLESANIKELAKIKAECGFDEMDGNFIKFIEKNQRTWFQPNRKIEKSMILVFLKIAVRDYLEIQRNEGLPIDQNAMTVFEKLGTKLNNAYEAKQKRRTTAFSKDIEFKSNLNKSDETGNAKPSTATTSTESTTSTSNTTSSATTSSSAITSPPEQQGSEENSDEKN